MKYKVEVSTENTRDLQRILSSEEAFGLLHETARVLNAFLRGSKTTIPVIESLLFDIDVFLVKSNE
jgi:hypothetical protein